jgi:hypothetical protein
MEDTHMQATNTAPAHDFLDEAGYLFAGQVVPKVVTQEWAEGVMAQLRRDHHAPGLWVMTAVRFLVAQRPHEPGVRILTAEENSDPANWGCSCAEECAEV